MQLLISENIHGFISLTVGKQEYINLVLAVWDIVILLKTCLKYRIRENSVDDRCRQGMVTLTQA